MIAGWIVYCLVVSTLLATAAATADALMTRRGYAGRWVWIITIVATLATPAIAFVWQQRTPDPIAGAGEARFGDVFDRVRQRERTRPRAVTDVVVARIPRPRAPQIDADRAAIFAVIACIIVATVRVGVDSVLLFRERRRWARKLVDGQAVLLSEQLGPAIVGLIEPTIVLPGWAAELPDDDRHLVLAHEREHVRARDGLLASAGLLGVLCMPWSPALWWAFRRLRIAIEVDCDRRVLRSFPDVGRYGRLLVDVAQRASGESSLAITGFSERAGPLARRIRAMTLLRPPERARSSRAVNALTGTTCACATLAALAVLPPAAPARELPQYSRSVTLLLPKGVADSIVSSDPNKSPRLEIRVIAAAQNLPAAFEADSVTDSRDGLPPAGRCREWLRDPRTGVRIRRVSSTAATTNVVQRGDTAWTRVTSMGFYRVETPGAYGVADGQLLRVGCGAANGRLIAGQRQQSNALSDLESSDDDRARKIGAAVTRAIGFKTDAVELFSGRLNIVITDEHWMDDPKRDVLPRVKQAWAAAREVVAPAAMPETLAFSIRARAMSLTRYYYSSHAK